MNYYGFPADFQNDTIDRYFEINKKYPNSRIHETYGQITFDNSFESGRLARDLPQISISNLKDYIRYSEKKGICFNYTINGTCMGNREFTPAGVSEIKNFIYTLYEIGVRSFTVALTSIVEVIQSMKLDISLKASTLCEITNPNKALAMKEMKFDRIVLDESINRDFSILPRIASVFGDGVELIVNTLCFNDCAYRVFHYNQMSHSKNAAKDEVQSYYNHQCMLQRTRQGENILRLNWIRPEDISHYNDVGINYFKIQGRNAVIKGDPVRVAEAYMQQSFDGNLMDLLELFYTYNSFRPNISNKSLRDFIQPYIQKPGFCKHDCEYCGYCGSYFKKLQCSDEINTINDLAQQFYSECDEYKIMIKKQNGRIQYE